MCVFMNQQVWREVFISLHGITENRAKTVRSKATPWTCEVGTSTVHIKLRRI